MSARRTVARVHGLVQGVGFRWAAAARAEKLGLAGTVRNLLDGTVEADLEGEEEAVGAMLDWLAQGPPSARVEKVEHREEPPRGARGFRIAG